MYKASLLLNSATLPTLYCSLCLPYINYCSEVWGIVYKRSTDYIIKLQNKAIRIISKADKYEHTNKLFIAQRLLKFCD